MDTIPLWCIIFINCITLLSSVWILIYLYRNRSKKSFSTYIYGIASLIGLFLGVISFFYYICHAFCAILFGIEIFIDTYMEQKKSPVNRTYFKITIPHPYVLKGYYCGIGFMFYGIMVILSWYKQKYVLQLQVIKDNYATFAVPYNGEDNNDYVDDEVVQNIEYVPFGEVFVEERNNIWNTPYLFNAKEFDEETGLYYYGARYYDSRHSLWISTDPMQEYRLIILGGTVPPRIILITLKNLLK